MDVRDTSRSVYEELTDVWAGPGHFLEVEKLLPLLLDSADGPSFHVVAPSLPGFGFSDFVYKTGFALDQYAELCDGLMRALGYKHYGTSS
jgi:pimeloyl-ACP methyl ester carboxylesterase